MTGPALYWLGIVCGFGAIVVYFVVLAMRPRWVRVLHGSGLFFSGLGLMQAAILVRAVPLGQAWFNANVAIITLSVAVVVHAYLVLRNRKTWDGVERRADPDTAA